MDGQHKQRWVGVILLLLLAAMLAPFVFRTPEQVRLSLDMEAPTEPPVTPVETQPAIKTGERDQTRERIERDREAIRTASEASLSEDERRAEAEKEETGEDEADRGDAADTGPVEEPPLSGWSVQVASFTDQDNATRLGDKLRDAGYNAYQRSTTGDQDKKVYRVYVGPELQREDARALKRRITGDEAFELEGLVVPYHP